MNKRQCVPCRPWSAITFLCAFILAAFIAGCSHQPVESRGEGSSGESKGRYAHDKDSGPEVEPDLSKIPDAVPRHEQRTAAGNKNPYTILGQTYHLIEDETSYKERGYASWYGNKFNGYHTSNGEVYDMYAMSAAHKTLPIPSYVRVTNLTNGKSVVVRVNDRGPFHSGRIIDLSYAAAQRIGINKTGTAYVEVEIALPDDAPPIPRRANSKQVAQVESALPPGTYLQVGAFSNEQSAQQFANSLRAQLTLPVVLASVSVPKVIHRVRLGPFADAKSLQNARDQLARINITEAHVVYQ